MLEDKKNSWEKIQTKFGHSLISLATLRVIALAGDHALLSCSDIGIVVCSNQYDYC